MALLSERIDLIKPAPTAAVSEYASELMAMGRDIISLGAGEPDFDTPIHIQEAAQRAMEQGQTHYTAVAGTVQLRQAISEAFKLNNNLEYAIDQISVGCGGKQSLFNAMLASLDPGDEVIIPAPYWACYPEMVLLTNGVPKIVPCLEENNFKLVPEDLDKAINPKSKWLILNSPGNPSGATYSPTELKALAEVLLVNTHVHVLTDDIYEHIIYDDASFVTMASLEPRLYERTLTVNGVSKAYSMTGWRVGWAAGQKELIQAMNKIQSLSTTHTNSIAQAAAIAALNGPQDFIKQSNKFFLERRDIAVRVLNEAPGLSCNTPEGAFYAYASCKDCIGKKGLDGRIIESDSDFATFLLDVAGVGVVPGAAFGTSPFFRISFATSTTALEEACQRIYNACSQLR